MHYSKKEQAVVEFLQKRYVATKKALCTQLLISHMTVVRALSKYGYYSSCNWNSAYYTLADIPVFDSEGLWSYQGVCFSRFGTLEATIAALVDRSEKGFTVKEMEEHVGTKVNNLLCKLCRNGRIRRFYQGRCAVYTSVNAHVASEQSSRREQQIAALEGGRTVAKAEPAELPEGLDTMRVIHLLVQMIRTPDANPASLSQTLQAAGIRITADEVRRIIQFYSLKKKVEL